MFASLLIKTGQSDDATATTAVASDAEEEQHKYHIATTPESGANLIHQSYFSVSYLFITSEDLQWESLEFSERILSTFLHINETPGSSLHVHLVLAGPHNSEQELFIA